MPRNWRLLEAPGGSWSLLWLGLALAVLPAGPVAAEPCRGPNGQFVACTCESTGCPLGEVCAINPATAKHECVPLNTETVIDEKPVPEPTPTPSPSPTPPPVDKSDFTINATGGYSITATGDKTGHAPSVDLAVGFDLSPSIKAPRLELFGYFNSIPGLSEGTGEMDSFGGFGVDALLSQPVADLYLRPAVLLGFQTRIDGENTPLHRSARFGYLGVRFAKKDRGGLFVGAGADERMSTRDDDTPDYLPAAILAWRVRIGDIVPGGDLNAWLIGRALLYLRLGYVDPSAGADQVTLALNIGWGNQEKK